MRAYNMAFGGEEEYKRSDGGYASDGAFTSLSRATRAQVDGFFYNLLRKNAMLRLVGCVDAPSDDIVEDYNLRQIAMFERFSAFCAMCDGALIDKNEKTTACDRGGRPHVYIDHTLKTSSGENLGFYTEVKGCFCCFAILTRGEYHCVSLKAFKPETRGKYYYAIDDIRGSCNISKALSGDDDMSREDMLAAQLALSGGAGGAGGVGSLTSLISSMMADLSSSGLGSGTGSGTGVNSSSHENNENDTEHPEES